MPPGRVQGSIVHEPTQRCPLLFVSFHFFFCLSRWFRQRTEAATAAHRSRTFSRKIMTAPHVIHPTAAGLFRQVGQSCESAFTEMFPSPRTKYVGYECVYIVQIALVNRSVYYFSVLFQHRMCSKLLNWGDNQLLNASMDVLNVRVLNQNLYRFCSG